MLHTEALELFSARGDDSQTARELAALASIQFRSGNVERALTTIESALPLYERAQRPGRTACRRLRLAGNAAAELGQHDTALDYLRRAERQDKNGITIERTRVLIAGELRTLGDLRGAEQAAGAGAARRRTSRRAPMRSPNARDCAKRRAAARRRSRTCAKRTPSMRGSSSTSIASTRARRSRWRCSLPATCRAPAAAADTAVGIETRIRVSSANPELRARFLSASYAPYEARIEVDLAPAIAGGYSRRSWKAFRVAEAIRARSLADRLAHARASPLDAATR